MSATLLAKDARKGAVLEKQEGELPLPQSKGETPTGQVAHTCGVAPDGIKQAYFKTWSSNMAYVLGFWYANGYIYAKRCFDLSAPKKDRYIVKRIAEELGFDGRLCDGVDKQLSRINFSCKAIYDDIVSLGGAEQKERMLNLPDVPDLYMPDFVRGHFDGSGHVARVKGGKLNAVVTAASKGLVDKIWDVLRRGAGVGGGSYDARCNGLHFGTKDTLLLGQYMYKNNSELFLMRKRQKFPI